MRKGLCSFLLIFFMSLICYLDGYCTESVKIEMGIDGTIIVSGNISQPVSTEKVTFVIIGPGEKLVELGQTNMIDGGFKFEYIFSNSASDGEYDIYINGKFADSINYKSDTTIVNMAKSGNKEQINLLVNECSTYLGIDKDKYNSVIYKDDFADELKDEDFNNISQLKTVFSELLEETMEKEITELEIAVKNSDLSTIESTLTYYNSWLKFDLGSFYTEQKLFINSTFLKQDNISFNAIVENFAVVEALARINNTEKENMDSVVRDSADLFNIDIFDIYNELSDKSIIYERLYNKGFEFAEDFKTEFSKAETICAINEAKRENVLKYLEKADDLFDEVTLTGFNKLKEKDRNDILVLLISSDFNNENELGEFIEKQVKKKNDDNSSGGSSGGGSGGGGGSSFSGNSSISVNPSAAEISVPTNANSRFDDLYETEWAEEAIIYLADSNIVSGVGDRRFEPLASVKREEFVKILVNAFAIEADSEKTLTFSDVSEKEWYYPYINIAYASGLINGITEESFGIGQELTREDLAVLLYRVLEKYNKLPEEYEKSITYEDVEEISPYALEGVLSMSSLGYMNGVGDNMFAPKQTANRAMAAKVIYEIIVSE